jgi:hypothetical protein
LGREVEEFQKMAQGQVKKTGGSQLAKQHKKAQNTKLSKGGNIPANMDRIKETGS